MRFLPLGSAVTLKGEGEQIFIITARAITLEGGEHKSNYKLVKYPEGDIKGARPVMIKDDDVESVVHEGYSDEIDETFLQGKIIAAEKQTIRKPVEEIPEPDFTNLLDKYIPASQIASEQDSEAELERLRKDPFYKFKKKEVK